MKHINYLTIDEITRIMQYENEETNYLRDIILFSSLTGLKFSDMDIIQVADIVMTGEGKRWLSLYNELPLHYESIFITPALALVIDRNIAGKKKEDILFDFPSQSIFRRHLRLIDRECQLRGKVTTFTGQHTSEHHYGYMSQNDPNDLIKNHYATKGRPERIII